MYVKYTCDGSTVTLEELRQILEDPEAEVYIGAQIIKSHFITAELMDQEVWL